MLSRITYSTVYLRIMQIRSFAAHVNLGAVKQNLSRHHEYSNFIQKPPKLNNPFLEDIPLQKFLTKALPKQIYAEVAQDLHRFGQRIVDEIYDIGLQCDQQLPFLNQFDAWGTRVDELITSNAWKNQRSISAKEGMVAIAYERKFREWSRLYQMAKIYLYSPVAGLYTCPVAMTDGAAKTIEECKVKNSALFETFDKLVSRDPSKFWTSGQWMTERKGGSDVAMGTETIAVQEEDFYRLYGYKWFSSATDANIALTLARIINKDGSYEEGTRGLSLFYVEIKDKSGMLNNIQIVKLKNKLGTRQVPTAELLLNGTKAYKMSEDGCGVSAIANMLCITRIHNASSSVGLMRSILRLARDYSQRRHAFGKKIGEFPLHMQTLSRMELEVRGAMCLLFEVSIYLGKVECKTATDEEALLLRLLTPVLKLYTAKQAVSLISEGLEAFGGQGYIEDTGLPAMLRDAQVLPIWEGTTNILSLDVLRSIAKTDGEVLKAFMSYIEMRITAAKHKAILRKSAEHVHASAKYIIIFLQRHPDQLSTSARDFAYSVARTFIGASLLENASIESSTELDVVVAKRWCELKDLCPLKKHGEAFSYSHENVMNDYQLVMEGYEKS